jgi:hypothetical protein
MDIPNRIPIDVQEREAGLQRLKRYFPFGLPSAETLAGTYLVHAEEYQLDRGFHQTSSSALVLPRNDERLLVPAIAFGDNHPPLNLKYMLKEGLPITHEFGRRMAVWWRRNIVAFDLFDSGNYTPEASAKAMSIAAETKNIYQKGLQGKEMDKEGLGELIGQMVKNYWYRYYTRDLPNKIQASVNREAVSREVGLLFNNLNTDIGRARGVYSYLNDDDKELLHDGFNFMVQSRMPRPTIYMDEDIPVYLAGGTEQKNDQYFAENDPRSPLQITGDPRGTFINDVERVYLPDDIQGSKVDSIALNRLVTLGISPDKVGRLSELYAAGIEVYDSCQKSYGDFLWPNIREAIESKKFIHINDID